MRKLYLSAFILFSGITFAQTGISQYKPGTTTEGIVYYLPKTAVRIKLLIEKNKCTPGEFYQYAEKYFNTNNIINEPSVKYKILNIGLSSIGIPDTSKCYAIRFNAKSAASNAILSDDGILLAINATPKSEATISSFITSKRLLKLDPRKYMNQDILSAGSTAKMAELTAQEIYDIRESKSQLTKGQADFMPKDGEQLKIMLANLDVQENALQQTFTGSVEKDTIEQIIKFCPNREIDKQLLFRFSKKLGMVDNDDLSGTPYYISITDEHLVNNTTPEEAKDNKKKEENGLIVNVPGKIKITIFNNNNMLGSLEMYAGQFGNTETLSNNLFNKKYTTHVILNSITGSVESIEAEQSK